jgi:hypothetical protein
MEPKKITPGDKPEQLPLHVVGTIGEQGVLVGGGEVAVQGYGLVVGLGNDGSSEVPPHVRDYIVKVLLQEKLSSWREGTEKFVPAKILEDKDTAVVLIGGSIPPGAPKGTRFDVFVSALRQTSTRSLAGGVLMPADMHLSLRGMAVPGGPTKSWAKAGGGIFVNPFVDPTDSAEAPKLREGRIIGGGEVIRDRPIHLQLRVPDYAMSQLIQRRVNERFPARDHAGIAKNRSMVELIVPREYRGNYEKFLQLVMHLPLRSAAGTDETRALGIVKAMETEGANHDELALVWEAMGRELVPIFSRLYLSENPNAAFYSARTGLRLHDWKAADIIIKFATTDGSPLQIPAIKEMGDYPQVARSVRPLRQLVNNDNELVRVAAYESLLKLGDGRTVARAEVGEQFTMDLVETTGPVVIYATQTGSPKIVIFGRDTTVRSPIFFNMPDDLVTINAQAGDKEMLVFRKIPRLNTVSPGLRVDFRVASLITLLGSRSVRDPDGNVRGLNLTYGQIIGVIHRMCKNNDIPAKFVLQQLPQMEKIYRGSEMTEDLSGSD